MTPKSYSDNFFTTHLPAALASAEHLIPHVLTYLRPASVVDVGCGIGAWLSVWVKHGVTDVWGIDGDYVPRQALLIEPGKFATHDLNAPLPVPRRFDLAVSLEVAEHLDPAAADTFVQSLCSLSDVILFSAAVPGQEGTLHVNEQYPSYWAERFAARDYLPVDCLRDRIWNDSRISWWYRQNTLFYVRKDRIGDFFGDASTAAPLSHIHPGLFEHKLHRIAVYERALRNPVSAARFLVARALGRHRSHD